jgi:hypothetical protein
MNSPTAAGPIVVGFVSTPEGHAALRQAGHEALLRKLPLLVVDLSREGHDVTPTSIEPDLAELRVGKFLLGSSAQRILLEADCPVLTVKSEPAGRRSG